MEEGMTTLEELQGNLKKVIEGLNKKLEEDPNYHPQLNSDNVMGSYTTAYHICTANSDDLYSLYKNLLCDYINETLLSCLSIKHDELFLKEFIRRWKKYKLIVGKVSKAFIYLERFHIVRKSLPNLGETGTLCFKDLVYKDKRERVRDIAVSMIDEEREGLKIDRALMNDTINLFVDLGIDNKKDSYCLYRGDFEDQMIEDSGDYYRHKASMWMVDYSCSEFMVKAENCLKEEEERVLHYLQATPKEKLLGKVEQELLVAPLNQLYEDEDSGLISLLRDDKVDDLARAYGLSSRVIDGLVPVSQAFKQYVTSDGMELVNKAEEDVSKMGKEMSSSSVLQDQQVALIGRFIELHDKYQSYVKGCFQSDHMFFKALSGAFETFLNKSVAGISIAEMISVFCDRKLKKGSESNESVDATLEKVVKLLMDVYDRDMFAEFHRKKLSRRLLFDKNDSDEQERNFLSTLKEHFGRQFTSKMEGMVTDLALSRDSQTKFISHLQDKVDAKPGFDFSVTVLTSGFWPTYKTFNLNLPPEMLKCVEAYNQHYLATTNKRKLTWLYSLGTCNIKAHFEPKTMELNVTTFQACALLLFNSSPRLSYSEIKDQLDLSDDDCNRLLHSLSCAKYKILNKEPNTKTISKTDYFEFNSKFTDKLKKIKIPLPPVDERKKIVEGVTKDRRFTIDAALVRIMKSRKVLGHHELVTLCVEALAPLFKPDFKVIKKQIEDLITKDYLERDKEDSDTYIYMA
ncbi:cullin-1-like [Dioscorea cayenensis subsp. rotundata]|uniref:Cullin-1-like n=1 Tax=Dioscorea cayennensis subsp. rotundata TaxID=55577 RepID=A0AB40B8Y5_DIOCR|nr:cullin-1-like [Dioscorea cayenensis subsp. rotundata]